MTDHHLVWHKVAINIATIEWQPNNMAIVTAGEQQLTIIKQGSTIMAFAHKCPHAGAVLANGFLDAPGNVVCPLHHYRFNPFNGRNISGQGYHLKTYPIQQLGDGVYIGIEANR